MARRKELVTNESYLGFAPHPDMGAVVPGRKSKSKRSKHNTRLLFRSTYMQASCRCFKNSVTNGACSAHFAHMQFRLLSATAAVKRADVQIELLESLFSDPTFADERAKLSPVLLGQLEKLFALRKLEDPIVARGKSP